MKKVLLVIDALVLAIAGWVCATNALAVPVVNAGTMAGNNASGGFPSRNTKSGGSTIATETGNAIQHVSTTGVKTNDGRSWTTAKATLQEAYDALPAAGGQILVAGGKYTLTSPIKLSTVNKAVDVECIPGANGTNPYIGATQLDFTLKTGTAITLQGGQNVAFHGCTLIGPGSATSTTGLLVGGSGSANKANISDNNISGFGVGVEIGNYQVSNVFSRNGIHDNGINILMPPGLPAQENVSFIGGVIANKSSYFSRDCVNIQSSTDIHFTDVSFDQCGITLNHNNVFADFVSDHWENPNGTTSLPFITLGISARGYNVNIYGGYMLEDGHSSRTSFIDDTSRIPNHGGTLTVVGLTVAPAEMVPQFFDNSGGQCCVLAYGIGMKDGLGGPEYRKFTSSGNIFGVTYIQSGSIISKTGKLITAGTIKLVSTSGSHEFATAYSVPPVCTATDTTNPTPVRVTSNTTEVSVTGTEGHVVSWVCTPAAK